MAAAGVRLARTRERAFGRIALKNRLSVKIAAVLLVVFLAVGVAFVLISRHYLDRYMLEVTQELNRPLAAYMVSQFHSREMREADEPLFAAVFHSAMMINPSVEMYLLDDEGAIVEHSLAGDALQLPSVDLQPVQRYLTHSQPLPILGDDPRNVGIRKIFAAAPLGAGTNPQGYVYIVLGGEVLDELSRTLRGSYVLHLALWSIALLSTFASVAALIIFSFLTRRIRLLTHEMDVFRRVHLAGPANPTDSPSEGSGDEIEQLRRLCYVMAERITQQVNELKDKDATRRRLVASVSHDLRTPMASVQGYLETALSKDGELDADLRRQYLATALRSTQRLSHLIDDLFELTRLELRETALNAESFSLGELVHDAVQQFALATSRKRIRVQLDFDPDECFVLADIALLERVMVNLIDNAVRHTPENGTVTVAISPAGNQLQVRIFDSGPGIPDADLKRVFNAFYRGPRRDAGNRVGAGLGLAIVKQILEMHGSTITAENHPVIGTVFAFSLPAGP